MLDDKHIDHNDCQIRTCQIFRVRMADWGVIIH